MKNTLITLSTERKYLQDTIEILEKACIEVTIGFPECGVSEEKLIELAKDKETAMIGTEPWTRHVIESCPNLRLLVRAGTGFDTVDLEAATECGIIVANTPYLNTYAVSEYALALTLSILRNVTMSHLELSNGIWNPLTVPQLRGKIVGLLGFGRIAQVFAELLQPFGCTILAYDLYPNYEKAAKLKVRFCELHEILSSSDVISVHMPLTPETRDFINKDTIKQMKAGVFLINTSRGRLVNPDAVYEAVISGKIAGAAFDVHPFEPLPKDYILLNNRRIILTPHCASSTIDASLLIVSATAQAVLDYYAGREVKNILN